MLIVALTGGIGSGKTTVGDIFSELGAVVIDSDQLARAVLERGSKGFDLVLAKFGDAILKNGELDRSLLATLVFNDSQKRSELESITHPLIRQSFAEIISSLPRES
ncbi:MAG: dephospho-CoA kinase, partial [Candidatus Nanopelagicus sp.]